MKALVVTLGCVVLTAAAVFAVDVEGMRNKTVRIEMDKGACAGVYISPKGYILSCAHCFEDGNTKILVSEMDNMPMVGKLIGLDRKLDLALVVVPDIHTPTQYAVMASGPVKVGDDVYIVGHPFGLGWSFTKGVVSGLNRFNNWLLQTDAVANPGNSGGPVYNNHGELIGVLRAGYPLPWYAGQTFAVALNVVRDFLRPYSLTNTNE